MKRRHFSATIPCVWVCSGFENFLDNYSFLNSAAATRSLSANALTAADAFYRQQRLKEMPTSLVLEISYSLAKILIP
jgi:hypothetical protein